MNKTTVTLTNKSGKKAKILIKSTLLILGMLFLFSIFSSQIKAQVYIFEHSNYEGKRMLIRQNTPWVGDNFNDIVSSLTVPAGWEVILYEHANYQGRSKVFRQNTDFVGDDFNDITSSIKIQKVSSQQISVNIKFQNQTSYSVSVYWINDTEKLYNNLSGNSSYDQQTYVGHRWRLKLDGKILGDYVAGNLSSQTVRVTVSNVEAGPIWNQQDAEKKCNDLARNRNSVWTGAWRTTEVGRMSVCELARLSTN